MRLSDLILPVVIGGILFYGIIKKVDIYTAFIDGAMEGAKAALKIFPYILAVIFAINMFIHSGAEDFIVGILTPVTNMLGFPPELLSLSIVKPLSGGGSLGVFQSILDNYGPDIYRKKCICVDGFIRNYFLHHRRILRSSWYKEYKAYNQGWLNSSCRVNFCSTYGVPVFYVKIYGIIFALQKSMHFAKKQIHLVIRIYHRY